jgi:hypothetical protein
MSFENSKIIAKFLEENKPMTLEAYGKLKSLCEQEKQASLHLYRMAGFTKALFLVSRYQVYFYCIGKMDQL